MISDNERNMKSFFALMSKAGVKTVFLLNPPEGGDVKGEIQSDGEINILDKRDGKKKKILLK